MCIHIRILYHLPVQKKTISISLPSTVGKCSATINGIFPMHIMNLHTPPTKNQRKVEKIEIEAKNARRKRHILQGYAHVVYMPSTFSYQ